MWRTLSLRARINCLIGVVLAFGLMANIARLVLEARPRVEAEDRSAIRLAREVIASVGPGLGDRPDTCLLYTSPSPRDGLLSRMPSSA